MTPPASAFSTPFARLSSTKPQPPAGPISPAPPSSQPQKLTSLEEAIASGARAAQCANDESVAESSVPSIAAMSLPAYHAPNPFYSSNSSVASKKKTLSSRRGTKSGAPSGAMSVVGYDHMGGGGASRTPSKTFSRREQQQHVLEDSAKMLEYVRKEVQKLRYQNQQLNTDLTSLQASNKRLIDANASLAKTCDMLNTHAKSLKKTNLKLGSEAKKKNAAHAMEIEEYQTQVESMQTMQKELKEELAMKQGSYIGEVQTRLKYKNAIGRIVEEIQGRCSDHRLVECVLAMADDCENGDLNSTSSF